MREIEKKQRLFGQVNIAEIQFDPKSRDDIPQILKGIQHIYVTDDLRTKLFEILEKLIPAEVNKRNGRPGMELWKVFVMGTLKLNLDWDYDRLQDMVNNHQNIRAMLGHDWEYDGYKYNLQTIKDNVALFTPEILDEINQLVVHAGHKLLKKNEVEKLKGKCDSFVVQTNVHYPTDSTLLLDAMRKVILLTARLFLKLMLPGWRNYSSEVKKLKKQCREIQNKGKRRAQKEEKKAKQEEEKKTAVIKYLSEAKRLFLKVKGGVEFLKKHQLKESEVKEIEKIERFMIDALRQMEQLERRVLKGEVIPHEEKVFSIFERHTEWIVRGKAGVEVELGLKVCILEDQHGFILHHEVMKKKVDEEIAVNMVLESQKRYSNLISCSFDKGFSSKENKEKLEGVLEVLIMPKKGNRNEAEEAYEASKEFKEGRRRHSSVESGINGLEVHGLERCRDKGEEHFERLVALGIVARNLQKLGALLQKKERKRQEKMQQRKAA